MRRAFGTRGRTCGGTSRGRKVAVIVTGLRRRRSSSLSGTLSMYVGDPAERHDVPVGGVIHVESGTPLQAANHGDEDLLLYALRVPTGGRASRAPRPRGLV